MSKYDVVKVYGKKSALSFEADQARSETKPEQRVSVQGAPAVGERQYDWSKKIVLQLSDRECRQVYAVLAGLLPKFEAGQHGPEKNKAFSIEVQSGKFFCKVMQSRNPDGSGGGMFAVPIEAVDATTLAGILLRQLRVNADMTAAEVRQTIVDVYKTLTVT